MTTIKQLANRLGLSKQAVYNRITKEPLRGILENTDGAIQVSAQGTILISDEGVAIVTKAYEEKYKHNIGNRTQNTERTQSQSQNGEIEKLISSVDAVQKNFIEVLEQQQLSNAKLDKLLEVFLAQINLLHNKIADLEESKSEAHRDEDMGLAKVTYKPTQDAFVTPRSDVALKIYETIKVQRDEATI